MDKRHKNVVIWSTVFVFILLIIIRIWVHQEFSGKYVDSDETVNWLAAVDKSNGNWHTPYFYGQTYNVSVESIFAAGLIKTGVPVSSAVPVVTNVLGVLPFIFIALVFFRHQQWISGLATLVLGVILPTEYHLITSLARGFIGGITVACFGIFLMTYLPKLTHTGFAFLVLSYWINPNVVVLLVPVGIYLGFYHRQYLLSNWLQFVSGAAIAVGLILLLTNGLHPEYNVHNLWGFEFHIDYLVKNLKELDSRFLFLTPFASKRGGFLAILLVVFLIYFLVVKNQNAIYIVSSTLVFLLLTLALNKTLDGTDSVFFAYSRMYLALPFVLLLFAHLTWRKTAQQNLKPILIVLIVFAVSGFILKSIHLPEEAKNAVRKNSGVVQVLTIDKLCKECEAINSLRKKHQSEVVVFHSKTDEYTYGCSALLPELKTLYPEYDRRLWEYRKLANEIYPTVLFLDWSLKLDQDLRTLKGDLIPLKNIPYPAYLLQNNTQSIEEIYESNHLVLRPH